MVLPRWRRKIRPDLRRVPAGRAHALPSPSRPSEQADWLLSAELALKGPIIHVDRRLANRTRTYPANIDRAAVRRRLDPIRGEDLKSSTQRLHRDLLDTRDVGRPDGGAGSLLQMGSASLHDGGNRPPGPRSGRADAASTRSTIVTPVRPITGRQSLVGQPGKLEAIRAYGFRNPWRFQFDSVTAGSTAAMWATSAGEEVNRIAKGGNYDWPLKEGQRRPRATTCLSCVNPSGVDGGGQTKA